ncbi:MAG: hypothetical protein WDO73_16280 [Ignavibacteriota bacterium]
MRKLLWMAPMLAFAGWAQTQSPMPDVVPMMPGGSFIIPTGMDLRVRVDDTLSTERNQRGDVFGATLLDAVMANGTTVVPAGTHLKGHVAVNRPAGIFKGRAQLVLSLDSIEMSGRSVRIELTSATYEAEHKHKNLEDPDPNAGAVTGNREEVTLPAETVVHFTLGAPVRI